MERPRIALGVNIDHVASLRQARGTRYPDPVAAATLVEAAGAQQITVHPREDRRHIQPDDVRILRRVVATLLNVEMACTDDMLALAEAVRPDTVTFVPEKRQELTTEGGLNVVRERKRLARAVARLREQTIAVSLFVEPAAEQICAAHELGVDAVELHTGAFANATGAAAEACLAQLQGAARLAKESGLRVCAGHGLHYENIRTVLRALPEVEEYNIGHSIVARAIFVGIEQAVREMRRLLDYQREGS